MIKSAFGPRIVSCRWEAPTASKAFNARVHIEGVDRQGILHELISLISTHLSLNLRDLEIHTHGEVFHADLTVLVNDVGDVNSLCSKIHKIPGVQRAARITDVN